MIIQPFGILPWTDSHTTLCFGFHLLGSATLTSMYPFAVFKNDDENVLNLAKIYEYDYMDLDRLYSEITAMITENCINLTA